MSLRAESKYGGKVNRKICAICRIVSRGSRACNLTAQAEGLRSGPFGFLRAPQFIRIELKVIQCQDPGALSRSKLRSGIWRQTCHLSENIQAETHDRSFTGSMLI